MSQFLWLPLFADPGLLSHSEASQPCPSSRPADRNWDRLGSNDVIPQLTHHHPQPARRPASSRFIGLATLVYAEDPKQVLYIITFSTLPGAEKNQGQPCWNRKLTSPQSAATGWLPFTFYFSSQSFFPLTPEAPPTALTVCSLIRASVRSCVYERKCFQVILLSAL